MLPINRTVLSLMDDALYVYYASSQGVEFIEALSWEQEGLVTQLIQLLEQRCKNAPVTIVHDSIEQYYRKERVFTAGVGTLDKASMVSRKMSMVFPSHGVRAAVSLGKNQTASTDKMPADVYLFAAVSASGAVASVASAISRSSVLSRGLYLLPLEAVSLVETLSDKLVAKGGQSKWTLLIGQHRNGYVRQVVVKDGNLALTRMTRISETVESNIQVWTQDVVQEFQSTLTYLSRLGYQADDGLDVIVVAPDGAGDAVAQSVDGAFNFYAVSPAQAGKLAGVKLVDEGEIYADALHLGWIAGKLKLAASLSIPALETVSQSRLAAVAGIGILGIGVLLTGYGALSSFLSGTGLRSDLADKQSKLRSVRAKYQQKVQSMSDMGIDLPLVQSTASVYERLSQPDVGVLDTVRTLAEAMHQEGAMKKLSIVMNRAKLNVSDRDQSENKDAEDYVISLWLVFDETDNIELENKSLRDFRTRLRQAMPDHKVEITKFLDDLQYPKGLSNTDSSRALKPSQIAMVEIVKGGVK